MVPEWSEASYGGEVPVFPVETGNFIDFLRPFVRCIRLIDAEGKSHASFGAGAECTLGRNRVASSFRVARTPLPY
jgi:hypothetical protein